MQSQIPVPRWYMMGSGSSHVKNATLYKEIVRDYRAIGPVSCGHGTSSGIRCIFRRVARSVPSSWHDLDLLKQTSGSKE
jgi:hypothetical protein